MNEQVLGQMIVNRTILSFDQIQTQVSRLEILALEWSSSDRFKKTWSSRPKPSVWVELLKKFRHKEVQTLTDLNRNEI